MLSIRHDRSISAERSKVFAALSTSKGLDAWWTASSSVDARLKGVCEFGFGPGLQWQAVVAEFKANEKIAWRFTKSDADWDATVLEFQVIAETLDDEQNGHTTVKLNHSGWKKRNDHFRVTDFCWSVYLNGLKNYLEKGIVIPFDERGE